MKIKFCGATKTVTGSRHLVTVKGKNILLDCGLYQGNRLDARRTNERFLFDPKEVDCVLLSHAHIDHSGNLPNLVKQGFKGKIFTHYATKDICEVLLKDAAAIQKQDADYWKRHLKVKVKPLYGQKDVDKTIKLFQGLNYNEEVEIFPGIKVKYIDAGHVLGSALVILKVKENKKEQTLCFTGDLGRKGLPILQDPQQVKEADFLITESTYASHIHDSFTTITKDLELIINDVYKRGGRIMIPSFSLERTQEITYVLHQLYDKKLIPQMPVFIDSPLSTKVSRVFQMHPECYDKETYEDFLANRKNPFNFYNLKYITDKEDSKKLNNIRKPCIIIAGSGMCEAGRIVHHLKYGLGNKQNIVLVIGYMAKGTLGRKLVEGEKRVKILGKDVKVNAQIEIVNAFSAHADKLELLDYIKNIKGLVNTFLVHGEERECLALKENLEKENLGGEVNIPNYGDEFNI